MPWYRAGTVTVANGSPTVTGAGTAFVGNVDAGEAFNGPDGRSYEIAAVVSATQLTLAVNYAGASAGGQGYAVQPTSSFVRDLALQAAALVNTFGAVRDGIGQGLIPDGTVAAPGIRFANDQDTGILRLGANRLGLVAGGVLKLEVSSSAEVGFHDSFLVSAGSTARAPVGLIGRVAGSNTWIMGSQSLIAGSGAPDDGPTIYAYGSAPIRLYTSNAERARIDGSGNFLIGTGSGNSHMIDRATAEPTPIVVISSVQTGVRSAMFYAVAGSDNWNGIGAALYLGRHSGTNRSINAGGTLNASGADYAEYMTKTDGCGTIAPGDVCGVDRDGKLTRTWADAVSFVLKSTDPAYVGGDNWAKDMAPRPDAPGDEPVRPIAPEFPAPLGQMPEQPDRQAGEEDPAFGERILEWMEQVEAYAQRLSAHQAYSEAAAAYPAQLTAYEVAQAAWADAIARYEADLPAWEADLEARRVCVDRIAFAGQVPVNIDGPFAVGDYLIAGPNDGGIRAIAVAEADITFEQYRRRLGKVWAVRDGRPWVDVQHG